MIDLEARMAELVEARETLLARYHMHVGAIGEIEHMIASEKAASVEEVEHELPKTV